MINEKIQGKRCFVKKKKVNAKDMLLYYFSFQSMLILEHILRHNQLVNVSDCKTLEDY